VLRRHWAILALGCAILTSTVLVLYLGRGQTPLVDQWAYIFAYRSWSLGTLLAPHNGHLVFLSVLLYKAMFAVFGLESQLPYELVNLALSGAVAALLFTLIRSRVGDLLALAAAILILFYGAGTDTILPTYAYPNLIALASGLAMLLALRRGDMKGDILACLLLTVSIASHTIGIAFAAGAAVAVALRPPGQRLRRAWIFALPLAGYAAWVLWARKFGQENIYVHDLKTLGSALVDQASAVLAALTGLFTTPNGPPPAENPIPIRTTWGPVLLTGLLALVYVRMRRSPRPGPGAIVAAVVLLVYFLLVGMSLNQFRNTFDTRLVYLGSVLMLVAVAELLAPYRPSRDVLIAVAVVFVFSMCASVAELGDGAQGLRAVSSATRARLDAVKLAGRVAAGSTLVEEPPGAMAFSVDQFHELDADFSLPAYSEGELEAAAPGARQIADEELVRVLRITPRQTSGLRRFSMQQRIEVSSVSEGVVRRRRSCVLLVPVPGRTMIAVLRTPHGGIAYSSGRHPVAVTLGRFADTTGLKLPPRSGSVQIPIPADSGSAPWVASLHVGAPTLLCPIGAGT
jgi:hypothetical protein